MSKLFRIMIRNNKLSMESENEDKLLTLINLEQVDIRSTGTV